MDYTRLQWNFVLFNWGGLSAKSGLIQTVSLPPNFVIPGKIGVEYSVPCLFPSKVLMCIPDLEVRFTFPFCIKERSMTIPKRVIFMTFCMACVLFSTACVFSSTRNRNNNRVTETLELQAIDGWTNTGIRINPGDRVVITYLSGMWSTWQGGAYDPIGSGGDPNCDCNVVPGISHGALIGRIGQGQVFLVGKAFDIHIGESGTLFLGINDSQLADNSNSIKVLIEVESD